MSGKAMHLLPIDLSHQNLLNEKFKLLNLDISEFNFSNIFLFRKIHHYQLYYRNELFIKGVTRDDRTFLMPTSEFFHKISIDDIRYCLEEVDFFYPIPEEWLHHFDASIFNKSYLEDDSDYVYATQKLYTFEGTHLNSKRNLINQLLSQNEVETFPLDMSNISVAIKVLESWQAGQKLSKDKTDYYSCREALELLSHLQLVGYLVNVNGNPVGFVIGSRLNSSTFLVHFDKAERAIKGLYQYLYQLLASTLMGQYEYMNLEQDLGSVQLRQAKHSYHPDRMIHKWRVNLK